MDLASSPNRFQVLELLGSGGMASVHRARERLADGTLREVALKRLLPQLQSVDEARRSFLREAQLVSLLRHRNIAEYYDHGWFDGAPFIAFECVRGIDVRTLLKRAHQQGAPPPIAVVISIVRDLCDALDYAHNKRDESGELLALVHRDVSPANLLVTGSGLVKVIDFGVAKTNLPALRTHSGKIKGKFTYMAPEVVRGGAIDHRVDVFSAGAIAHELVRARPLFGGRDVKDILARLLHEPIPGLCETNPECPPELEAIVLRALSRDPDARFPSAARLRRALDDMSDRLGIELDSATVADWAMGSAATSAITSGPQKVERVRAGSDTLIEPRSSHFFVEAAATAPQRAHVISLGAAPTPDMSPVARAETGADARVTFNGLAVPRPPIRESSVIILARGTTPPPVSVPARGKVGPSRLSFRTGSGTGCHMALREEEPKVSRWMIAAAGALLLLALLAVVVSRSG